MTKQSENGEGDYKSGRAFNKKETDYIKANPDKIKKDAKKARDALDSPERLELEAAENKSRLPTKEKNQQ